MRLSMTFEQYVAELQALAEAHDATDTGKPYCDPENWRDQFNEGMSPAEAWREEMRATSVH